MKFGTDEQKDHFLPKMATGEIRAAFSLSEPEVGSDVQGIKSTAKKATTATGSSTARRCGSPTACSRASSSCSSRPTPRPTRPYKGMTCFICEKEPGADEVPGLTIPPKIKKMGYKGVESTELVFDGFKVAEDRVLGGPEGVGQGFVQMMDALEVGRVNVAARGVGVAQRALELALRYSQERKTFGKPIAQHQAITFKLAEMGTRLEAARLLTLKAARMKDAGERSDLEAGMAKLFASEAAKENAEESLADPRRVRVLEGVRDRAHLPRRAAALDRRGHLRDPEDGDREEAPGAKQDLMPGASALARRS